MAPCLSLVAAAGFLLFASCKSPGDTPPWEVNSLTSQLRARAGGGYAVLSRGVTHYELLGPDTGRVVVLVHGSFLPMWTWDRQVSVLADAGFRVLRYDEFGRGYSDRPQTDYNIELYCDQLGQLLDTLKLKKPVSLVGISFGCAIIATYASLHPGNVDKMIFSAPVVDPLNAFAKMLTKSGIGTATIKNQLRRQLREGIHSTLLARGMPDRYADLFIEQASIKGFQRSAISFFHNAALTDYRPFYRITGTHVHNIMLIWGNLDKTVRKKNVETFEKAIPQARVEILDGIGHLAPFEATERFNALLLDFLTK
jgi:pimeloyl-ACP methyl ester carboxylesterase